MKKLFFILLFIIECCSVNGQTRKSQYLEKIILSADTVLIISHDNTGIIMRDDETGRDITPKLVMNGKLNYGIMNEKKVLNDSLRKQLSKVLLLKNQSSKIVMNKCYMPQHAILIIKDSRLSYIDICFGCLKYEVSDDLSFFDIPFDINKWNELYQFFIQNGMEAMYGDKISVE